LVTGDMYPSVFRCFTIFQMAVSRTCETMFGHFRLELGR
jgi:hypothetical protein